MILIALSNIAYAQKDLSDSDKEEYKQIQIMFSKSQEFTKDALNIINDPDLYTPSQVHEELRDSLTYIKTYFPLERKIFKNYYMQEVSNTLYKIVKSTSYAFMRYDDYRSFKITEKRYNLIGEKYLEETKQNMDELIYTFSQLNKYVNGELN